MTEFIVRPAVGWRNRFRLISCVVRAGVAGLVFFCAAGAVRADIQQRTGPGGREEKEKVRASENLRRAMEIPIPQDAEVTVLRGVPTEIVLSSTAALRQPVIFRLGESPRHGTLTGPRAVAGSAARAVVTYTAGPGTAESDFFTFRVRHRETATSGSARVGVRIVDPKAELVVPAVVDFGEVVVGETAVRSVVVENRGTAAYAGRLTLEPPWRLVQETSEVEVAAGAQAEVRVALAPQRVASVEGRLAFPGVDGVMTRLSGRVVGPVRVQPSLLQLEWQPEGRVRRALIKVTNRLSVPVEYGVTGSPRLRFSAERGLVAARGEAEVEVSLPAEDVAELQSLLAVNALGVREEVPLTAPAAPPVLRLSEVVDWERDGDRLKLSAGVVGGTLVLANEGGRPAFLALTVPAGWRAPGYEDAVMLGPRETRRVLLVPPADREGAVSGELEAVLEDERLAVELWAPEPPAPPPAPVPAARVAPGVGGGGGFPAVVPGAGGEREPTEDEKQLQLMMDTLGVFPAGTEIDRSLPELSAVSFGKLKPKEVPVLFKSAGEGYTYVVFREEYRPPPGQLRPTRHWIPVEGLRWATAGETVSTTLTGLQPGVRGLYRFAVRAADGRISQPSVPVAVTPPVPRPFPWGWVVSLATLTGLGYWWRRRRRLILGA